MFENLDKLIYRPLVETDRHEFAALAGLSQVVGYPVPGEFVEFLKRYPDTGIFEVDGVVYIASPDRLSGHHDGRYAVDTLYAACSDKRYDLLSIRQEGAGFDLIPNYCLRIGEDSFGNAFCIDLREEPFGKVYFWDHEHAAGESGLHLVASSFASFVEHLEVA
ncbi:SMI1/KNR4 family protein [Roseateles sp. P5_E11]